MFKIGNTCNASIAIDYYNRALELLNLEPLDTTQIDHEAILSSKKYIFEQLLTKLNLLIDSKIELVSITTHFDRELKSIHNELDKIKDIKIYNQKYRKINNEIIGSGGFGRIYLIRDEHNDIK